MTDQPEDDKQGMVVSEPNRDALAKVLDGPKRAKYARFVVAAMSSVPWVGGVIGASAALHAENEQGQVNELVRSWLEEHRRKIEALGATLSEMAQRLDQLGDQVAPRLQEEVFLGLVRQGFRVWDEAATTSKRDYVRRTLTNAAATRICSDDVIRMFLDWIARYDDSHFRVMRVLFHNRGATRGRIWDEIGGQDVREDSAEADLFKLLLHDLSMGHVLRQMRSTTSDGRFLAKQRRPRVGARKVVLESAFEDSKPYELTSLGGQFVTYALNEAVPRIG